MKKRKLGLFPKVLIAITIGSLLGLIAPDVMIRIFKTFNVFFAQILKFIVPLLVLGLVTPSVANLGRGAGKMLLSVIIISYLSTIGAGFFAYGFSSSLLPHYLSIRLCTGRKSIPTLFQYQIPSDLRHTDGPPLVIHAQCRHHFHQSLGIEEGL